MKLLSFLIAVLPTFVFASERLDLSDSMFFSLGQGVYEDHSGSPNLCVKGQENKEDLPSTEVIYRLKTVTGDDGTKLYAEMIIVKSVSSVSSLQYGFDQKLPNDRFMDICGVSYISKLYSGSRIAFGKILTLDQAQNIPSVEMRESNGISRAQEFVNLVNQVTQGLPSYWPIRESKGPSVPTTSKSLAVMFEDFKAETLKSNQTDVPVQAHLKSYPNSLWKKMIQ